MSKNNLTNLFINLIIEMFPSLSVNDVDLHGLLYGNIILVGGNSLFSGYKKRM